MLEIDKKLESFSNKLDYRSITPENSNTVKDITKFWSTIFNGEKTPKESIRECKECQPVIKCLNEHLAEKSHPITKVYFEHKTVDISLDGKPAEVEVVVPRFKHIFKAYLPENKFLATDREQFKECNLQLANEIDYDKSLLKKFNEIQIEQILDGETPDGYVWHHDAEIGVMQLVPFDIHQQTGHTGGRTIWGGGNSNR